MGELGFLKGLGWWFSFLFVLIALALRMFWGINKDEGRGRWVAWLRHDRFARRYRELLDAGLNRLDRLLSPDYPSAPTDPIDNAKVEVGRAWSPRLLDVCLLLAVVYPVLTVLLDWALSGDAASFGSLVLLTAAPETWTRWLPIAAIACSIIAILGQKNCTSGARKNILIFFSITLSGFAIFWVMLVARDFLAPSPVLIASALLGALILLRTMSKSASSGLGAEIAALATSTVAMSVGAVSIASLVGPIS